MKEKEKKNKKFRIEVERSRSDLISYYFTDVPSKQDNEDQLILRDGKEESRIRTIVHLRRELHNHFSSSQKMEEKWIHRGIRSCCSRQPWQLQNRTSMEDRTCQESVPDRQRIVFLVLPRTIVSNTWLLVSSILDFRSSANNGMCFTRVLQSFLLLSSQCKRLLGLFFETFAFLPSIT